MTSRRELMSAANNGRAHARADDWRASAKCEPDDWMWIDHTAKDEPVALAEARTICRECPVKDACLEDALSDLSLIGIWAGTTLAERRRMVRNRDRKSRAQEATA